MKSVARNKNFILAEMHSWLFSIDGFIYISQKEFERGKGVERIWAACGRRRLVWSTNYPVPDSWQQHPSPYHGNG